jgi:DNA-binding transcriptional regulator YiaG
VTSPILTGAQVRAIRLKMGMSMDALARLLGSGAKSPAAWLWSIEHETQGRHLSYSQANLLLAIMEGYVPVTEYLEGK